MLASTLTSSIGTNVQGIAVYRGKAYVVRYKDTCVYRVSLMTGVPSVILGTDGTAGDINTKGQNLFTGLVATDVDCPRKSLILSDYTLDRVKQYSFPDGTTVDLVGNAQTYVYNGPGPLAGTTYNINGPYGVTYANDVLYIAESACNRVSRRGRTAGTQTATCEGWTKTSTKGPLTSAAAFLRQDW